MLWRVRDFRISCLYTSPNDPKNGIAAVVYCAPAVIHSGGQQEILDIPLLPRRILPAGVGDFFEIDWAPLVRMADRPLALLWLIANC
jgi:hypothetical protein